MVFNLTFSVLFIKLEVYIYTVHVYGSVVRKVKKWEEWFEKSQIFLLFKLLFTFEGMQQSQVSLYYICIKSSKLSSLEDVNQSCLSHCQVGNPIFKLHWHILFLLLAYEILFSSKLHIQNLRRNFTYALVIPNIFA